MKKNESTRGTYQTDIQRLSTLEPKRDYTASLHHTHSLFYNYQICVVVIIIWLFEVNFALHYVGPNCQSCLGSRCDSLSLCFHWLLFPTPLAAIVTEPT